MEYSLELQTFKFDALQSELEFQLPNLEIQSDVWTVEVSRFGNLGSIRLGKLQPTPIFIAVKVVGKYLV